MGHPVVAELARISQVAMRVDAANSAKPASILL